MITSGITAVATTDDTAVAVIAGATTPCRFVHIVNDGTVAGFFTINGGTSWARLPASTTVVLNLAQSPLYPNVSVKRIASGSNLANVFAFAY